MISAWLTQHGFVFFHTLKRLIASPVTSLLSISVMGIALSLPTGVYVLMQNLQNLSGQAIHAPQMSLFLRTDMQSADVQQVEQRLERDVRILGHQFVSKETALQQLQQRSGFANVATSLERNPLPDAFILHLQNEGAESMRQLQAELQGWPEIEYVQFDSVWIERLDALLKLGRFSVLLLATILSIAIIAIMFNTIRLQILTKRDEIEISKLIGATDSFIRRPFLYFGAIQGLAGGATAWMIIAYALSAVNLELVELSNLYGIQLQMQFLILEDGISLLIFSTLLGWLGARLSVANHLWQIEPQ